MMIGINQSLKAYWQTGASCLGKTELFFSSNPSDAFEAVRICQSCPVKNECLALALKENVECGIWAGMSVRELNLMKRAARKRITTTKRVPA